MTDMSKTKLYSWKCPDCNSYGKLRVIDTVQQKIRMVFSFFGGARYFFTHCTTEIELTDGVKDNQTINTKASVFRQVEDLKGKI